jgi:hypothetical protein
VISTIGFFLLFMFHSTQILISINLGIIAIGLAFSRVEGFNIVAVNFAIKAKLSVNMSGRSQQYLAMEQRLVSEC